jgi:hypothetical protein
VEIKESVEVGVIEEMIAVVGVTGAVMTGGGTDVGKFRVHAVRRINKIRIDFFMELFLPKTAEVIWIYASIGKSYYRLDNLPCSS